MWCVPEVQDKDKNLGFMDVEDGFGMENGSLVDLQLDTEKRTEN